MIRTSIFCLIIALLAITRVTHAQNIVQLEYSIDTFVKEGNGTPIDLTGGQTSIDQVLTIEVDGLAPGLHNLYIRAKNDEGRWSFPVKRSFYVHKKDTKKIHTISYRFYNDGYQGDWQSIKIDPKKQHIDSTLMFLAEHLNEEESYTLETYGVNDKGHRGFSAFRNVTIRNPVPPEPQMEALDTGILDYDTLTIALDTLFEDEDIPFGDSLTYSLVDTLNSNIGGLIAWEEHDVLSFKPSPEQVGKYNFWIKATDIPGLSDSLQVSLEIWPSISMETEVAPLSCYGSNDGMVSVEASGGKGQIEYRIEGAAVNTSYDTLSDFNELPAGDYTVYVTSELPDYEEMEEITIEAPELLEGSVEEVTQPACPGVASGSILLGATGGNGGYKYMLGDRESQTDPEFKNLMAGKYQVMVEDSKGCQWQDSVEITPINPPYEADITVEDSSRCGPGSLTLTVSSSYNDYNWYAEGSNTPIDGMSESSFEFEDLQNDTTLYVAAVNANGCESERVAVSATLKDLPEKPEITIAEGEEAISQALVLKANVDSVTYQWYLDGEAIEGATDQTYEVTGAGEYAVEVANEAGCAIMSESEAITNVEEGPWNNQILFYPNPVEDVLTIEFPGDASKLWDLKLFDLRGKLLVSRKLNHPQRNELDLLGVKPGVYMVILQSEGQIIRHKLQVD